MANPASYVIVFLLSFSLVNSSVLRTQTKDIFSMNEHLYNPDLYRSLYQETSRRKRLYVVPGLNQPLQNQIFDIDELEKTNNDEKEIIPNDLKDESEYLNKPKDGALLVERSDQPMEDTSVTNIPNEVFDEPDDPKNWNGGRLIRTSERPIVRRILTKLTGRHRKRYKAGVVDRIAHGFGKRSLDNMDDEFEGKRSLYNMADELDGKGSLANTNNKDDELDEEELQDGLRGDRVFRDYLNIAELLWILENNKGKRGLESRITRPKSHLYEALVAGYLKSHGRVIGEEDGGNDLL